MLLKRKANVNLETLSEAKRTLLLALDEQLDELYTIFYDVYIGSSFIDVAVMKEECGLFIIKVIDLKDENKIEALLTKSNWTIKQNNIQKQIMSPFKQIAEISKSLLYNNKTLSKMFFTDTNTLKKTISLYIYFHNLTDNCLKSKQEYWDKSFPQSKIVYTSFNKNKLLQKYYITYLFNKKTATFDKNIFQEIKALFLLGYQQQDKLSNENIFKYFYNDKRTNELICSVPGQKRKVCGPSGSGKTRILSLRALDALSKTKDIVLILTFNISLKNYIRHILVKKNIKNLDLSKIVVEHYNQFIWNYISNNALIPNQDYIFDCFSKDKDYKEHKLQTFPQKFKTILVDEVQDFKDIYTQNINNMIDNNGELVYFGDEKQNIYKRTMDDINKKPKITGIKGRWYTLTKSYRTNNQITSIANNFQKEFLSQKYTYEAINSFKLDAATNSILKYYSLSEYCSEEQLNESIFNIIKKFLNIPNDEICIIAPSCNNLRYIDKSYRDFTHLKTTTTFEDLDTYLDLKRKYPSDILRKVSDRIQKPYKEAFNIYSNNIKLSTIYSIKGLEANTVIVLIENLSKTNENSIEELIYTAITRARKNLIIIDISSNKQFKQFFYDNNFRISIEESFLDYMTKHIVESPDF